MFNRCYDKNCKQYREFGEVHKNWHSFVKFVDDSKSLLGYKEMIKNPEIIWCIDKDFIKEENQLYSKENCCFIPRNINTFITISRKDREYKYEGLYIDKYHTKPFSASVKFNGKSQRIPNSYDPLDVHKEFWNLKLEIAHKYIEQDYPFVSVKLRQVIYNRVKLRELISLKELNRAIDDGYFKNIL